MGDSTALRHLLTAAESSTTFSDVGPPPPTTTTTTLPPVPAIIDSPVLIGAGMVILVATVLAAWRAFRSRGE